MSPEDIENLSAPRRCLFGHEPVSTVWSATSIISESDLQSNTLVVVLSPSPKIVTQKVFLAHESEGYTKSSYYTTLKAMHVRRAVWGMLYADDAGIVSRSPAGLARMMTVIVEVFGAFGLTVSEKKTETLLMRTP